MEDIKTRETIKIEMEEIAKLIYKIILNDMYEESTLKKYFNVEVIETEKEIK